MALVILSVVGIRLFLIAVKPGIASELDAESALTGTVVVAAPALNSYSAIVAAPITAAPLALSARRDW
ncbi:MAG: hypothetical protein ACRDN0_29390 [Trebonia sp.]